MNKNITVYVLICLYFLSVLAGIFIILSQKTPDIIGMKTPKTISIMKKDTIGIINISGPIRFGMQAQTLISYDAEMIIKKLKQFAEKSEVKAIILRINSPGGSVAAVQEIYSEILNIRKKGKIVIASFEDISASGGYYIACACDKIMANPGTITGSIGVVLEVATAQELLRKIGIKIETIKSGKYKDSGSFARELTREERMIFQSLIDDAYNQFIRAVSEGRNMDTERVYQIADGRVFTGLQAKEVGLVDIIGNGRDAIELAKKMAKIEGEPKIITETTSIEKLFSLLGEPQQINPVNKLMGKEKIRFEYMLE